MRYKYELGDSVIVEGHVDGVTLCGEVGEIVAIWNGSNPYYTYLVEFQESRNEFHRGRFTPSQMESYLQDRFEDDTDGRKIAKDTSGRYFHVHCKLVVGLSSKAYDPKQQPWDEGDI